MPGRANATHCIHGHEYTPENVYLYTGKDGRPRRTCRKCQAARERRQKARRQARRYSYPSYE